MKDATSKLWKNLIAFSDSVIEDNTEENEDALEQHRQGFGYRGCRLATKGIQQNPDWLCQFYIGGAQRILGRGTLYQCAKLYDHALIFFGKYRVKTSPENFVFNFSKEATESEATLFPATEKYLGTLEKFLLEYKFIIPPEQRKDEAYFKRRASNKIWRHKQTASYQLKTFLQDINEAQVHHNTAIAELKKAVDKTNERLETIEKLLLQSIKA